MNMHLQGGVAKDDGRPNAGIDVSKHRLDVCCGTLMLQVVNDARGWDELAAKLREVRVDLVVLEVTGEVAHEVRARMKRVKALLIAPSAAGPED